MLSTFLKLSFFHPQETMYSIIIFGENTFIILLRNSKYLLRGGLYETRNYIILKQY